MFHGLVSLHGRFGSVDVGPLIGQQIHHGGCVCQKTWSHLMAIGSREETVSYVPLKSIPQWPNALTGYHLPMFPCSPNMPQAGDQTCIFREHLRHCSNMQDTFAIFFKAAVLNKGQFYLLRDLWQCLQTVLVLKTRRCCWHLVPLGRRGQG